MDVNDLSIHFIEGKKKIKISEIKAYLIDESLVQK